MPKSFPKIIKIFFLLIFIFQLACLIFIVALPQASLAADPIEFKPQVQIGDYKFDASDKTTGNIAKYISAIYKYAIGIVGILAAVVLMVGGVMWIMAGGSATMIGEAKAWIGASLTGLTLALLSYLILATVNPALVELRTTAITPVAENKNTVPGCCIIDYYTGLFNQHYDCYQNLTLEECKTGLFDIPSDARTIRRSFYDQPNGSCAEYTQASPRPCLLKN